MAENTREIILDTLLALEKGGQYSHRLIRAVLDKYNYLDGREKSFFKRVTEGTIEREIELDYYLNAFSSVPVKKMKPFIRALLRMSVYQLLYMDAVPDSAVCNEACRLAAKRGFGSLRGFVNGVLRNISRNKDKLPLPDREKEPLRFLSVRYSVPEWLAEMWLSEYGTELTETMLAALMEVHPVSVRFSTALSGEEREYWCGRLAETGARIRQGSYLPFLYELTAADNITELPGFAEGRWTVQDVSSALAVTLAGIRETDFVMDVCAAPGGKSMLAAERARNVLSRDLTPEKTAQIRENATRMRADNVAVQEWDARCFDPAYEKKADVVLLDVPCSGLGVMGKKRDIKYHVTPESMEGLCALQREIVTVCSRYVKPGGTLLYSTCTINPAENEEMVRYLTEELGFEPVSVEEALPEELRTAKHRTEELRRPGGKRQTADGEMQGACMQFYPGYMNADGFFIAKLKKPTDGEGTAE